METVLIPWLGVHNTHEDLWYDEWPRLLHDVYMVYSVPSRVVLLIYM
jgi:hypothetical protein